METYRDFIAHHGVSGMKWGVRNQETLRKYGLLGSLKNNAGAVADRAGVGGSGGFKDPDAPENWEDLEDGSNYMAVDSKGRRIFKDENGKPYAVDARTGRRIPIDDLNPNDIVRFEKLGRETANNWNEIPDASNDYYIYDKDKKEYFKKDENGNPCPYDPKTGMSFGAREYYEPRNYTVVEESEHENRRKRREQGKETILDKGHDFIYDLMNRPGSK